LSGSTTGESQPAVVKCGVCANADGADAAKTKGKVSAGGGRGGERERGGWK
jgi:hypothetical protein